MVAVVCLFVVVVAVFVVENDYIMIDTLRYLALHAARILFSFNIFAASLRTFLLKTVDYLQSICNGFII